MQEIFAQSGRRLLFTDAAETTSARTGQAAILTDVEQLKYQPLKEGKNQIGYNRLNEVLRIEPGQFFGLSWELQKEATAFQFNLPKSGNLSGRVFEWSADGNTWQPLKGIPADKAQFTLEKVPSQARCIRMRNTSDQQMQINLNQFAVTTKEDTSIDPIRLMYDKNLESANRVAAGARLTLERSNPTAPLELFLSGMPNSHVIIKGNASEKRSGTDALCRPRRIHPFECGMVRKHRETGLAKCRRYRNLYSRDTMNVRIEESWRKRLQEEFDKPYFAELVAFVKQEYRQAQVLPPRSTHLPGVQRLPVRTGKGGHLGARPLSDAGTVRRHLFLRAGRCSHSWFTCQHFFKRYIMT